MFVACLRITLAMPQNGPLKHKRVVVQRLRDQVRRRFAVAVAEVATQDDRALATLGIACVSNDAAHGHAVLMRIRDCIEHLRLDAELRELETEILQAF
jgi:uncharacterized protein YlxP (DUF503 family)